MSIDDTSTEIAAPVSFTCSACNKNLKAKPELADRKVKCSQCGKATIVPAPAVSESSIPVPRKWWILGAAIATILTVSTAIGGILLFSHWSSGSSGNIDPNTPYQSQLQPEIDKVKARKSNVVDARQLPDKTIVDKDLAALVDLPNLNHLNLDNTQITNAGAKIIARITSLESLSLTNTQVNDAGLAELQTLISLDELRLDGLPITDAGLASLKAFPQLRKLSLYQTRITDAGLVHLKSLSFLERLSLDDTAVSNDGLRHLTGLTKLKYLSIWKTQVNKDGIQQIRTALPNVHVNK